ncbi:hypothetical protein C2S52_016590 [Perilla frutescens var. hirtella]|nr:hypothetical protein C2S52_016590 [Perilla frutescens var. hirtella]
MQRSISCHSLFNIEPENSYAREAFSIADSQGTQHYKWSSNSPSSASENSIFESMNRATPYSPEEKKERIERYRSKRNLRNFNKKIKYECRKTLADSRPRVRGRFARNDEREKAHQPQPQRQWDCPFVEDEDDGDDYSWINILDALNKSDALISSF